MAELRIGPQGRDDDLTRALRAEYALPADPAYWSALEARIMAHIDSEGEAWWEQYRHWVGRGLVAAAAALVAMGLTLWREHDAEVRIAYEEIVETPRTPAQQLATTDTRDASGREATLRYLIGP